MKKQEVEILTHRLQKDGKLNFPVSPFIGGLICGSIYRAKRRNIDDLNHSLKHRVLCRMNKTYRELTDFAQTIGIENLDASQSTPNEKGEIFLVFSLKM